METTEKKTWGPTVAGILDIVAGGLTLTVLVLVFVGLMIAMLFTVAVFPFNVSLLLLFIIAIPGIAIEALAVAGGVFAIQRRKWGWALAGSIAATIISTPLGIAAIIFTVLSKNEFE